MHAKLLVELGEDVGFKLAPVSTQLSGSLAAVVLVVADGVPPYLDRNHPPSS